MAQNIFFMAWTEIGESYETLYRQIYMDPYVGFTQTTVRDTIVYNAVVYCSIQIYFHLKYRAQICSPMHNVRSVKARFAKVGVEEL